MAARRPRIAKPERETGMDRLFADGTVNAAQSGQGRALFRVADLVELARLVTRLSSERRSENPA